MNASFRDLSLREAGVVLRGPVNDVLLGRDSNAGTYYTVWLIKDHEAVRNLLRLWDSNERGPGGIRLQDGPVMLQAEPFRCGLPVPDGRLCFVLPYVKERPLKRFYPQDADYEQCEQICRNLVTACMSSELPAPLLLLALKQGRLHLRKDNRIETGYALDLKELSMETSTADCVTACALILRDLLADRRDRRDTVYPLLIRKIPRKGYREFTELYSDIKKVSRKNQQTGVIAYFRRLLSRWYKRLFCMMLAASVVLTVIVLVMLLSGLIFGDIPLLRLFINPFTRIGTESLLN